MEEFDLVLNKYINRIESPDRRDTYESLPSLVERIIKNAKISPKDTIIDMGSGWGNVSIQLSKLAHLVVGIEPNKKNLKEAQKRIELESIDNIEFIKGSFEAPNYKQQVDKIISSLVFHQMNLKHKRKALNNVKKTLKKDGVFILCDTLILFDPYENQELFNKTYRYLLKKTTPKEIYEKYIKRHFEDTAYIYSWDDMKKYTPEDSQFYCIKELLDLLQELEMKIINIDEICPFFGIINIVNKEI